MVAFPLCLSATFVRFRHDVVQLKMNCSPTTTLYNYNYPIMQLRYALKRIVNIMKVEIEIIIMQLELLRYRKHMLTLFTFTFAKRLGKCIDNFTGNASLFARWRQVPYQNVSKKQTSSITIISERYYWTLTCPICLKSIFNMYNVNVPYCYKPIRFIYYPSDVTALL